MMENLENFEDKKEFIKLSEINDIVNGFQKAKSILQKHIIKLYQNKTSSSLPC